MKFSPRADTILFSVISAFTILFILIGIGKSFTWSGILVIILLFSICSYILYSLVTHLFIFRKIKRISSTIHSSRTNSETSSVVVQQSDDPIEQLSNEVQAWTDERKAEIEQLKKLETYRKEYLGNVSHELKTPIFNIQGYILTLLDGGLEDPNINRDYLTRAENSVERMIGIVEDLQAITQLETGELQLENEKFDIAALSKDILHSHEMRATAKGIILSLPEEKPVFVFADKFRIRQVLTNLVVNSVKYGKEYGETKIRFSDIGENILVEISDNGIGIGKEHLPRLFERFYRVDKSRSRDQGGTGLGLAIVKHIIEAHSQTINVMSTEGAGSVFSFTLKKG